MGLSMIWLANKSQLFFFLLVCLFGAEIVPYGVYSIKHRPQLSAAVAKQRDPRFNENNVKIVTTMLMGPKYNLAI